MSSDSARIYGWLKAIAWSLWAVLWLGGTSSHVLFGGAPANAGWAAPVFLLLAGVLVVISSPKSDWPALAATFTIGFAVEVIGVKTGYPFGQYSYSPVLGPSLLGVPVVMGGAWTTLIAWVRQLRVHVWAGALIMTAADLVIDPLAVNPLHFWQWAQPGPYYGIPLGNFVGWFVVSAAVLVLLRTRPARSRGVTAVGCAVLLFFTVLGLAHRLFLPAALGVTLVTGACLHCILETCRQDLSAELA